MKTQKWNQCVSVYQLFTLIFTQSARFMLTAGEVWGVVGVGQKQVVGLGHPEVHHLRCIFQSSHCILMHHILQTDIIHLKGEKRIYIIHTNISKIKVRDKLKLTDRIPPFIHRHTAEA